MSILDVPGARLFYEARGSGPLVLMIPGASGTGDAFGAVAERLAARYTVVTYDRRGFSRSLLDGSQDYDHRLEIDADDVERLLQHLGDQPAIVFGSSSGAIVALKVLTRHPSVIRMLLLHEPPAVMLLADCQRWIDFFFDVYDLYRGSGMELALRKFTEEILTESDRRALARGPRSEHALANSTYWFEHELRQYPAVELDLDDLRAHADRIAPMAGRESSGYPTHEASVELAKKLDRDLIEMPGGHLGFLTRPAEFADDVIRGLARGGPATRAYPAPEQPIALVRASPMSSDVIVRSASAGSLSRPEAGTTNIPRLER